MKLTSRRKTSMLWFFILSVSLTNGQSTASSNTGSTAAVASTPNPVSSTPPSASAAASSATSVVSQASVSSTSSSIVTHSSVSPQVTSAIPTQTDSTGAAQLASSTPTSTSPIEFTSQPSTVPSPTTESLQLPPGPDSLNTNNQPDSLNPAITTAEPTTVASTTSAPTTVAPVTVPAPSPNNGQTGGSPNTNPTIPTQGGQSGNNVPGGNQLPNMQQNLQRLFSWMFYSNDMFPYLYLLSNQNSRSQSRNPAMQYAPLYTSGMDMENLLPLSFLLRQQQSPYQQQTYGLNQQYQPNVYQQNGQRNQLNNLASLYWYGEM